MKTSLATMGTYFLIFDNDGLCTGILHPSYESAKEEAESADYTGLGTWHPWTETSMLIDEFGNGDTINIRKFVSTSAGVKNIYQRIVVVRTKGE